MEGNDNGSREAEFAPTDGSREAEFAPTDGSREAEFAPTRERDPRGCPPGTNRGGGPKTPDGMERALANLQGGAERLQTHGANSYWRRTLAPPCRKCLGASQCEEYEDGEVCRIALRAQAKVEEEVKALDHIKPLHHPLVRDYAKLVIVLDICDVYLEYAGLFVVSGEPGHELIDVQPVVASRDRFEAAMWKAADKLLLTPAAEAQMNAKRARTQMGNQLAWAFQELAKMQAGEAAVQEGEFEADDDAQR